MSIPSEIQQCYDKKMKSVLNNAGFINVTKVTDTLQGINNIHVSHSIVVVWLFSVQATSPSMKHNFLRTYELWFIMWIFGAKNEKNYHIQDQYGEDQQRNPKIQQ